MPLALKRKRQNKCQMGHMCSINVLTYIGWRFSKSKFIKKNQCWEFPFPFNVWVLKGLRKHMKIFPVYYNSLTRRGKFVVYWFFKRSRSSYEQPCDDEGKSDSCLTIWAHSNSSSKNSGEMWTLLFDDILRRRRRKIFLAQKPPFEQELKANSRNLSYVQVSIKRML